MQKLLREYLDELNKRQRKHRKVMVAAVLLVVLVVGSVAGILAQYGVAMTAAITCGLEEHQHNENCYKSVIVCGLEEREGHVHTEECLYPEELVCGLEENESHTHGAECYQRPEGYACGLEEQEGHVHSETCYATEIACGQEEHIHTDICYIDAAADVEDQAVWDRQYGGVAWKGAWGEDLATAAGLQVGYQESVQNYTVAENGNHKGYTRYGQFAGDPYGDWDAAFVNFCMHYAGLRALGLFPGTTDSARWCEEFERMKEGNGAFLTGAGGYVPVAGDLVFAQRENEETAVQMGIVAFFDQARNEIHVIEGNSQNGVRENIYPLGGGGIVRYLKLTELEASYKTGEEAPEEEFLGLPGEETLEALAGEALETPALETLETSEEGILEPPEEENLEDPDGETPEALRGEDSEDDRIFTTGDPSDQEDPETLSGEEEPVVDLTTEVDGTTITLSGPKSSFEEGKEYFIQAEKVEDKEVIAMIEEAIATLEEPAVPDAATEPAGDRTEGAGTAPEDSETAGKAVPEEAAKTSAADTSSTEGPDEMAKVSREASGTDGETQAGDAGAVQPEKQVVGYQAFDIKLMADGEEVQPSGPVSVKFSSREVAESVEKQETEVKVVHVDENTGKTTDMEAVATEEKDVVIETDHFSVYVYVHLESIFDTLNVTVEHWSKEVPLLVDKDGNPGKADAATATDNIVDDSGADGSTKKRVRTQPVEYEIYSANTLAIPNEYFQDITRLSKVCNATVKNYDVSEVWICSGENVSKNIGKKAEEWEAGTYEVYEMDLYEGLDSPETAPKINLEQDSLIRFWYTPVEEEGKTFDEPVVFYDYDITDGKRYGADKKEDENGTYLYSNEQGINSSGNFVGSGPKLGVGQQSSGNMSPWAKVNGGNKLNGSYLNQGNGGFKIVPGIVKKKLGADGNPEYNVAAPGTLFSEGTGSKAYTDYQLKFYQVGDTYTLNYVYKDGERVTEDLRELTKRPKYGGGHFYSNLFWPMDAVTGGDPHIGRTVGEYTAFESFTNDKKETLNTSDDFKSHNWHFGMTYSVNFTVGDYTGPMEYYFRGDDEFWLFIDGYLAVDIGGIHSAVGHKVDLREWMENATDENGQPLNLLADKDRQHTMKVFYMERGGFGSCCYMQFTLPNSQPVTFPTPEYTTYEVRKEWDDNDNPFRPGSVTVVLQQLANGKVTGTDAANPVTLNEENGWSHQWTDLPKVAGDSKEEYQYTYSVTEIGLPKGYTSSVEGSVLTNKLEPVKIKVEKRWENDDGLQNDYRPDSVTMQLYYKIGQNGEENPYVNLNGEEETIDLTADTGWSGEFTDLPQYYYPTDENGNCQKDENNRYIAEEIYYSVRELSAGKGTDPAWDGGTVDGKNQAKYSVTYSSAAMVPEGEKEAALTVTNTLLTSFRIEKNGWAGNVETKKLEGAGFVLYAYEEGAEPGEPRYMGVSNSEGIILWTEQGNLAPGAATEAVKAGTYLLKETRAPDGYMISKEEWVITVGENGRCTVAKKDEAGNDVAVSANEAAEEDGTVVFTYTFYNEIFYTLPATGGRGIYWYLAGGMLLIFTGAMALYKNKRREVPGS